MVETLLSLSPADESSMPLPARNCSSRALIDKVLKDSSPSEDLDSVHCDAEASSWNLRAARPLKFVRSMVRGLNDPIVRIL